MWYISLINGYFHLSNIEQIHILIHRIIMCIISNHIPLSLTFPSTILPMQAELPL